MFLRMSHKRITYLNADLKAHNRSKAKTDLKSQRQMNFQIFKALFGANFWKIEYTLY